MELEGSHLFPRKRLMMIPPRRKRPKAKLVNPVEKVPSKSRTKVRSLTMTMTTATKVNQKSTKIRKRMLRRKTRKGKRA